MGRKMSEVKVTTDSYGKTKAGQAVKRFTLRNSHGVRVQLITYGAIITSIHTPDSQGCCEEITLGFDDINGYLSDSVFFGVAAVGRVCGRIANAQFTLDGQKHTLAKNNGPHHAHGGYKGFARSMWEGEVNGSKVTLTLVSPDGDDEYPGELTTKLTFELTEDSELCIESHATTTKPTPVNLTSHPYFNLALKKEGNILNHTVQVMADQYVPFNADVLPTGELADVADKLIDLRQPVIMSDVINQVNGGQGFDTCYCLRKDVSTIGKQLAARAHHKESGRYIEVYTTKPGLNIYTAYYAIGVTGRDGHVVPSHGALCLEPEHFPDSVNQPNFPSTIIRPGEEYRHSCSYKFGVQ